MRNGRSLQDRHPGEVNFARRNITGGWHDRKSRLDHRRHRCFIGHVDGDVGGIAAGVANELGGRFASRAVDVRDHDLRAGSRERLRRRSTDAAGRAGDDRDLPFENLAFTFRAFTFRAFTFRHAHPSL